MLRSTTTLTVAVLAFAAACTGSGADQAEPVGQAVNVTCDAPVGSWTNLDGESPQWRADVDNRVDWSDEAGCAVNLEFVFHTFGSDHCGGERTERISIGVPFGTPYTGDQADPPGQDWEPLFFHNSDDDFEQLPPGEVLSIDQPPTGATDVGLRSADGRQLWATADASELYEVQGDSVRVFVPASDEATSCA